MCFNHNADKEKIHIQELWFFHVSTFKKSQTKTGYNSLIVKMFTVHGENRKEINKSNSAVYRQH